MVYGKQDLDICMSCRALNPLCNHRITVSVNVVLQIISAATCLMHFASVFGTVLAVCFVLDPRTPPDLHPKPGQYVLPQLKLRQKVVAQPVRPVMHSWLYAQRSGR